MTVRLDMKGGEGVSALELEKVAYVLGKGAVGAERHDVGESGEEEKGDVEEKASAGGMKRKAKLTGDKKSVETKNEPAAEKAKRTKGKKGTTETGEDGKGEGEVEASKGGKKRKAESRDEEKLTETANEPAEKKTRRTPRKKGTTETD